MLQQVRDGLWPICRMHRCMFISALTGAACRTSLFSTRSTSVYEQNAHAHSDRHSSTSVLADATARVQPPTDKGRRLQYLTI